MTFKHPFRLHRSWADCTSLTLVASLALSIGLATAANAQIVGAYPTIGNARPIVPTTRMPAADPADMLSMHLRTLSVAPRSLSALLGAGESALAVGDANAALGFYARAEEVDGRSGKAKAGLASALVMLERADDALPLFARAIALGVPEAEVARDRGLAYDLRGDSRRAQRDYQLALRRGPDDEITRRYALSLGISGDRAQAMTLLDPLLRKQDQSAWRARAFILAMTGDVAGANGIARQVMPANLASTMSPFLSRLPQLNAADKAHAVAFGTMPSAGTNMAAVEIGDPFHAIGSGSPSDGLIPGGEPLGTGAQTARAAVPLSREPRRRPGREVLTMAAPTAALPVPAPVSAAPGFSTPTLQPAPRRTGTNLALASPVKQPSILTPSPARTTTSGTVAETRSETKPIFETSPQPSTVPQVLASERPAFETAPVTARTPVIVAPATATPTPALTAKSTMPPVVAAPIAQVPADNRPAFEVPQAPARTAIIGPPAAAPAAKLVVPQTPTVADAPKVAPAAPMSRLASILAGLTPEMESAPVALPTAAEARQARRLAQRKAAEAAAVAADLKAEKEAQAAELAEARRNPARLWVQVATGNNERGLPTTWNRIRDDNEAALKGRSAFSVPFKATNRLLVGPMKSPADARALVNALAKNGLSANTFSSEAGQEVTRIGGK